MEQLNIFDIVNKDFWLDFENEHAEIIENIYDTNEGFNFHILHKSIIEKVGEKNHTEYLKSLFDYMKKNGIKEIESISLYENSVIGVMFENENLYAKTLKQSCPIFLRQMIPINDLIT